MYQYFLFCGLEARIRSLPEATSYHFPVPMYANLPRLFRAKSPDLELLQDATLQQVEDFQLAKELQKEVEQVSAGTARELNKIQKEDQQEAES